MPVQGLSRKQIRQSIAQNCLGPEFWVSEATAAGTVRVLEDNLLRGGDQDHRGKWGLMTSGTNLNTETRVEKHEASIHELTLDPELGASTADGDTYEMYSNWLSARMIHQAMLDAGTEAVGLVYEDEESLALHGDGVTARFDLPSEMDMVKAVYYRGYVVSRIIHNCDSVWDETTDADFTQTAQTLDKKQGGGSLRLVIAAAAAANDLVTENISSLDLSQCTHLELWVKSTVATAASDLHILLDDTAACASPLETLSIPALVANTWTFVRVALANPALDTAIISVGFRYTVDIGAATIFLDDIKGVAADTARWERLPDHLWRIDKEERDMVLTEAGMDRAGYHLLKLVGGSNPTRMTADTDTSDIPEDFVIARATSLLLMAGPEEKRPLAAYWVKQAEALKAKFPWQIGVRRVG